MKAASLVIRAFNEAENIGRLLEGISRQTVRDVEVILVDSGSTDSTAELAASAGAKIIHISPLEFTFGRSLNLGIAAARHDLVVLASAHVYPVYPDWLEHLLEPFDNPQVVLTYGKQLAPDSAPFSEQQIYHRWYGETSDLRQAHPFCNNANAAVRRSTWQAHPYDETLTGLEDLSWAGWALDVGHVLAYVSEAEIIHVHDEKKNDVLNRYRREALAFIKRIYPQAHFSLYDFTRRVTANIFSDLWHALKTHKFWHSAISVFWYRFAQFWGTYQGYRRSLEWSWDLRQTFYYPHGIRMPEKANLRPVEPIQYG